MVRKNVFARVGRPPNMGLASKGALPHPAGAARAGALGQPSGIPGGGAGPMQGLQTQVPGAAFKRGGRVPAYHDDAKMSRSRSEHGFNSSDAHFAKMCRGGRS